MRKTKREPDVPMNPEKAKLLMSQSIKSPITQDFFLEQQPRKDNYARHLNPEIYAGSNMPVSKDHVYKQPNSPNPEYQQPQQYSYQEFQQPQYYQQQVQNQPQQQYQQQQQQYYSYQPPLQQQYQDQNQQYEEQNNYQPSNSNSPQIQNQNLYQSQSVSPPIRAVQNKFEAPQDQVYRSPQGQNQSKVMNPKGISQYQSPQVQPQQNSQQQSYYAQQQQAQLPYDQQLQQQQVTNLQNQQLKPQQYENQQIQSPQFNVHTYVPQKKVQNQRFTCLCCGTKHEVINGKLQVVAK